MGGSSARDLFSLRSDRRPRDVLQSHGRLLHLGAATCPNGGGRDVLGPRAILPSAGSLALALGIGVWLKRHLGGLTGDVYGAAIELSEVAFLIIAGLA